MPFNANYHDTGVAQYAALNAGVQELIASRPGFIMRRGIAVCFMLVLLLCVLSNFIDYPEVVHARAVIIPLNAPKPVYAPAGGHLVKLNITEGQYVRTGAHLGYVENAADHSTVLGVKALLDSMLTDIQAGRPCDSKQFNNKIFDGLGALTDAHILFTTILREYGELRPGAFIPLKRKALLQSVRSFDRLYNKLQRELALQQEAAELTKTDHLANDKLFADKVIAAAELRTSKGRLVEKELVIPRQEISMINNRAQQAAAQLQILELEHAAELTEERFIQALINYRAKLDDWIHQNIITAPVGGIVHMDDRIARQLHVQKDELFCFIDPGNLEVYASLWAPQEKFGQIAVGQEVRLSLAAFPKKEYGTLSGHLQFISAIPSDSGYRCRVSLPAVLFTTYKKQIKWQNGMVAAADIIIGRKSLWKRITANLLE